MTDPNNRSEPAAFSRYESWLYQMPCQHGAGDLFLSVMLPSVGGANTDPPSRRLIVMGDVAGKGSSAAFLRSGLESEVVRLVETETDPALLLAALNQSLAGPERQDRFATM